MIELRPITPDNWRTRLKVSPEQERFVASPAVLLARAYAYREQGSRAFVIYDGDTDDTLRVYEDYKESVKNQKKK